MASSANRATESIELSTVRGSLGKRKKNTRLYRTCENTSFPREGVKIIGGRSSTGLDFGIFVRSVLEGGSAAQDGDLPPSLIFSHDEKTQKNSPVPSRPSSSRRSTPRSEFAKSSRRFERTVRSEKKRLYIDFINFVFVYNKSNSSAKRLRANGLRSTTRRSRRRGAVRSFSSRRAVPPRLIIFF